MIQKNEAFVNVLLFILFVVKILQETDCFAQQQRVQLFNTQIMKKLITTFFQTLTKIINFRKKRKLMKISTKK